MGRPVHFLAPADLGVQRAHASSRTGCDTSPSFSSRGCGRTSSQREQSRTHPKRCCIKLSAIGHASRGNASATDDHLVRTLQHIVVACHVTCTVRRRGPPGAQYCLCLVHISEVAVIDSMDVGIRADMVFSLKAGSTNVNHLSMQWMLDAPVHELMSQAAAVRDTIPGAVVTFSPKVFLPVTKLCRDTCGYCTFAQPPRPGLRSFMPPDEVLQTALDGQIAGCTEALITVGEPCKLF